MYKGKINQNRKYFDLSQFFALFFRKCLGNFLKELQFYTSGTTCFFIFCGAAKFCGCKKNSHQNSQVHELEEF